MRPEQIVSAAMRILNSRRKTRGAGPGRPPKLAPCPHCKAVLNATQRRRHRCTGREIARVLGLVAGLLLGAMGA